MELVTFSVADTGGDTAHAYRIFHDYLNPS
jgi:hypothetical protein